MMDKSTSLVLVWEYMAKYQDFWQRLWNELLYDQTLNPLCFSAQLFEEWEQLLLWQQATSELDQLIIVPYIKNGELYYSQLETGDNLSVLVLVDRFSQIQLDMIANWSGDYRPVARYRDDYYFYRSNLFPYLENFNNRQL